MSKTLKTLIVILVFLVLGLSGVLAYPYVKKVYKPTSSTKTTTPATSTSTTSTTSTNTVIHVSDPGVTWLSEPQKLSDLGLIKTSLDLSYSSVDYYKIANIGSSEELILAVANSDGPGGTTLIRFKKNSDGEYKYLLKHSDIQNAQSAEGILTSKATVDSLTVYQSLSNPNFLNTTQITFKLAASIWSARLYKDLENPVKVIDSQYGFIYKVAANSTGPAGVSTSYYLKLSDTTIVPYTLKFDFQADDEVSLITWKDATKNTAKYTPEGYIGCSSANINLITVATDISSRLIEAGTTNSGEKIYTVSKDDNIMKTAYDNYKLGRTENILSITDFAASKPVFVYKDGLGDYIVFTGREFAGLAECGKPVIYLYPTKDTQVSVKVGADITKSEPEYGDGWTNVLATPSGRLTVDGKSYNSLFWEGLGHGIYPNINQGVIVKKEDLKSTMENHLSQLGLNAKESADFMDFWWPKMPATLYTRLTWFGTKQMNQLAPLSVSPKPDTTIRIFLDFEGLNSPINIQPQKLSSIPRKGFTLVEWGGLLKGSR